MEIKLFLIKFVTVLSDLISYAIFARIILSWFVQTRSFQNPGRIYMFLRDVTEPILNLARKLPHKISIIDLSPLIVLIGINLLTYGIIQLIVYV